MVFPEALLRQNGTKYTCPGCLHPREDTIRMQGILLGQLFKITGKNYPSAGEYSMSAPFVEKLVMLNGFIISNGKAAVSTVSLYVRMLNPSPQSRSAIEFISHANARETPRVGHTASKITQ